MIRYHITSLQGLHIVITLILTFPVHELSALIYQKIVCDLLFPYHMEYLNETYQIYLTSNVSYFDCVLLILGRFYFPFSHPKHMLWVLKRTISI